MIPFNPEPLEQLKSRVSRAWEGTYSINLIQTNPDGRPSLKPQHVFDFEDGLRLILSRDELEKDVVFYHVSASVFEDKELFKKLSQSVASLISNLTQEVIDRMNLLDPETMKRKLVKTGFSPNWVLHILLEG